MDEPWRIRATTTADLEAIAVAEVECFADPWSAAGLADLLGSTRTFGLVAVDPAGGITGYLIGRVVAGEAEILNVATRPAFRGRGIGRGLLDEGLAECARRGAKAIFLEVRESNRAARSLYESRGFRVVGARADYYRHPREDGMLYRLDPGPASER